MWKELGRELKERFVSDMKLYWISLQDAARAMLALWIGIYCVWTGLWFISALHGHDGIFGQQILAIWSVQWQWHPSIILILAALTSLLGYLLYAIRSLRRDFRGH